MGKIEIELNSAGIRELLRSQEIKEEVEKHAQSVCDTAIANSGRNYAVDTRVGSGRAYASVRAADAHAYYSNLKHNTLVKALGSVKE